MRSLFKKWSVLATMPCRQESLKKYVAGLTLGNKRLLTIERTPEDALVISNFYSPVLICSE